MLDVSGSLRLTIDGQEIDVIADASVLHAEVARPRRLLRALGVNRGNARLARNLATALHRYGFRLVVTQRGSKVAQLGAGTRTGLVGKLLRIPYLRLYRK